jgi:CDP-4-dehydro-6-deoxyglucose reductase
VSVASQRSVRLVRAEALSNDVRSLSFAFEDDKPFNYRAGQWVNVYLDCAGQLEKRAYSIANAQGRCVQGDFEIAVTKVEEGPVSTALHALPIGSQIVIDEPSGFFVREDAHKSDPAVFVGTGTGLAPLRAMLQEVLEEPGDQPLILLFGCRTQKDILWRDELESWAHSTSRFRFEVTLSRAEAQWPGRQGYVQTHIAELVKPLGPVHVYICGLSKMVGDVRQILKTDLGFARQRIHSERYD